MHRLVVKCISILILFVSPFKLLKIYFLMKFAFKKRGNKSVK